MSRKAAWWARTPPPVSAAVRAVQSICSDYGKRKERYPDRQWNGAPSLPLLISSSRLAFTCSTYASTLCFREHDLIYFCLYPLNRQLCYNGFLFYLGLVILCSLRYNEYWRGKGYSGRREKAERRNGKSKYLYRYLASVPYYFWFDNDYKPSFIIAHIQPVLRVGSETDLYLGLIITSSGLITKLSKALMIPKLPSLYPPYLIFLQI